MKNIEVNHTKDENTYIDLVKEQLFTPLEYISNFAKRLMITNPDDRKTLVSIGEDINNEVYDLKFKINNIIFLEAIEKERLEFKGAKVDFDRILNKVLDEVSHLAKIKQIKISTNILCRNDFNSDIEKIYMILLNLVANALEFSVNNSAIQIILFEGHDDFKIIVKDEGRGIKEGQKDYIFDKFYEQNDKVIRFQKTQGLGLFVVKGLTDFLEGKIELDSRENEFTLVEVTIPKVDTK